MKDQSQKELIIKRFVEFATKNYGSVSALSTAIGRHITFFNKYVYKKSIPGGELLIELQEKGLDISWLLTGKSQTVREDELRKENEKLKAELEQCQEYFRILKVAENKVNYGKDSETQK